MGIKTERVKAFALQEMIVVLLITSIVVGMAFSVLSLVQKQMGSIENIYEVKLEANKLRQSLWLDFNRYSHIYFDTKQERLYFGNALDTKYYEFTEEALVTERDTFDIKLNKRTFFFNNEKKDFGEMDALELTTSKESGNQQIFVYKHNAAATYMNR